MSNTKMGQKESCCKPEELDEAIKRTAQEIYEKSGRKPGRDLQNWLEAERIIKARACRK